MSNKPTELKVCQGHLVWRDGDSIMILKLERLEEFSYENQ